MNTEDPFDPNDLSGQEQPIEPPIELISIRGEKPDETAELPVAVPPGTLCTIASIPHDKSKDVLVYLEAGSSTRIPAKQLLDTESHRFIDDGFERFRNLVGQSGPSDKPTSSTPRPRG